MRKLPSGPQGIEKVANHGPDAVTGSRLSRIMPAKKEPIVLGSAKRSHCTAMSCLLRIWGGNRRYKEDA
jgi:hypothetical protein